MATKANTPIWVDDYLDLINYAAHLGDSSWYTELIQTLDELMKQNYTPVQQMKEQLWQQYNTVLHEMLVVYERIRNTPLDENQDI